MIIISGAREHNKTRGCDKEDSPRMKKDRYVPRTTVEPLLLFLLVAHTQHEQVLLLEIVACDRVAVREHLAVIRQDESARRERAASHRDDAVAQRRHEQVQRQIWNRHDRAVQLPLWHARIRRQLHLQRNRVLFRFFHV